MRGFFDLPGIENVVARPRVDNQPPYAFNRFPEISLLGVLLKLVHNINNG